MGGYIYRYTPPPVSVLLIIRDILHKMSPLHLCTLCVFENSFLGNAFKLLDYFGEHVPMSVRSAVIHGVSIDNIVVIVDVTIMM